MASDINILQALVRRAYDSMTLEEREKLFTVPDLRLKERIDPATRSGALDMGYGDRIVYEIDGRIGTAGEFTQDGDVTVEWDDGTVCDVKWNHCHKVRDGEAVEIARIKALMEKVERFAFMPLADDLTLSVDMPTLLAIHRRLPKHFK